MNSAACCKAFLRCRGSVSASASVSGGICVRRSAFGVRRSAFGVRRSAFGVRRSAFGLRRSAFNEEPETVVRRALNEEHELRAFGLIALRCRSKSFTGCDADVTPNVTPNVER